MKVQALQEYLILGNFTGEPLIEEFEFTLSASDNILYLAKLNLKDKTIQTRCEKEVSDDFYHLLKTGNYKNVQISDETGNIRDDIDKDLLIEINNEYSSLCSGFLEVTERLIHYIKIWLSHMNIEGVESERFFCSTDGENWIEFGSEKLLSAIDLVIYSNLNEENFNFVQECLNNSTEPFIALDFLRKAQTENEIKYKWIYATIAAELAIKEFLIAKNSGLEIIFNELPSPPIDKLYGKILREYEGFKPYMKIKDIQTGVKVRNHLVHRPNAKVPITEQNTFIYIRLIEATIYQLLQNLYPQISPIIGDHYPPKMGYTELESISNF